MRLDGLHHVTAITGDARRNHDFYTRVLGLRLVSKAVNQDDPFVYHLFYGDESGHPGADLTFFEYPRAARGQAGAGMVHRVVWRVRSGEALEFWRKRLGEEGVAFEGDGGALRFADPEGLAHELTIDRTSDAPLVAEHPEIPRELALQGFDGVRAYARRAERSRELLGPVLGGTERGPGTWELRGKTRGGSITYEAAPDAPGRPGAGTVHHVAWGTSAAEHPRWQERLQQAHVLTSGIIDRWWFHSIYFREPNGVLFEIADDAPGFTRDTALEDLGKRVSLPDWLEPQRAEIEARLTPLPEPRAGRAVR